MSLVDRLLKQVEAADREASQWIVEKARLTGDLYAARKALDERDALLWRAYSMLRRFKDWKDAVLEKDIRAVLGDKTPELASETAEFEGEPRA